LFCPVIFSNIVARVWLLCKNEFCSTFSHTVPLLLQPVPPLLQPVPPLL
jgi:hypothetical protein